MPISMSCPTCGKTLSAPDSSAGKRAKCPQCDQIMIIPAVAQDSETFAAPTAQQPPPLDSQPASGPPENWLDGLGGSDQATGAVAGSDARRPCPECGEMIAAGAARCRFCNTPFDSRFSGGYGRRGRGQSYNGFAITSMVLGIVGIVTFCFGIVLGILAVIFGAVALNGMAKSRNPEGKGMAVTGLVLGIIEAAGWALWYLFFFLAVAGAAGPHF